MTAKLKYVIATFFALTLAVTVSSSVHAAVPDGLGPWADSVASTSQGLRKDGSAVPAIRSDASSALGVAENNTTDGNFYSLGLGGSISLGFDNGISSGVIVVEATNPDYPVEKANVEVSENGVTWVTAGTVSQDGEVEKPASVTCARFVRITDISNPNDFTDATADGYDVDGVKASGEACLPVTPTPTPPCDDKGCCTDGNVNITQKNVTISNTTVVSTANTGGNKANGNIGGTNTNTTGNAKSVVGVTVTGGNNTANVTGCCTDKKADITISGNGAGSKNTVVIGKTIKKPVKPLKK